MNGTEHISLQLFTPLEVAGILRLAVPTIYSLERRGVLRGVRPAGVLRFYAEEVKAFLERAAAAPRRVPPPALLAQAGRRGRRRR